MLGVQTRVIATYAPESMKRDILPKVAAGKAHLAVCMTEPHAGTDVPNYKTNTALKDGHAQTFRLLQDSVGGITPNTLNTRIKELREAGFVDHGPEGYGITPAGAELARRLGEVQPFAVKWAQGRRK